MAIFNSYVSLPEGNSKNLGFLWGNMVLLKETFRKSTLFGGWLRTMKRAWGYELIWLMMVIYWGLGKNGGISSTEDLGFHRENIVAFMVVMKYGDFEEIQLRHWWWGERIWENLRVQRNLGMLIKNSDTQYSKQRVNRRSSNHGFIMLCLCQSLGCPVGNKSAYRWLQPWMLNLWMFQPQFEGLWRRLFSPFPFTIWLWLT